MNTSEIVKIDVIFRKDKYGVFAVFPHEVETRDGNVMIYQHVGQHNTGDYGFCIKSSKPALNDEYKELENELKEIGYNLNIVKKQNYKKYLDSYYEVNKM